MRNSLSLHSLICICLHFSSPSSYLIFSPFSILHSIPHHYNSVSCGCCFFYASIFCLPQTFCFNPPMPAYLHPLFWYCLYHHKYLLFCHLANSFGFCFPLFFLLTSSLNLYMYVFFFGLKSLFLCPPPILSSALPPTSFPFLLPPPALHHFILVTFPNPYISLCHHHTLFLCVVFLRVCLPNLILMSNLKRLATIV